MPRQKVSVNCGLYVIYYMNVIGREESFDINFNPNECRKVLAQLLINESESMHNVCYFCFSAKKKAGVKTCKSIIYSEN